MSSQPPPPPRQPPCGTPPSLPPPPPGYPPGWQQPGYPPAWQPPGYPPAWQQPPPPQRSLLERTVLDEQMAASRARDPAPWGVKRWLGPVLAALGLVIVIDLLLVTVVRPHLHGGARVLAAAILGVDGELLLLAAVVMFGRSVAAREGGWRRAFGLDWIRGRDWLPWITGVGIVFLGRLALGIVLGGIFGIRALKQASNVPSHHLGPAALALFAVSVVVVAPVTEELMMRGLLLRTFMRRWRFWPSALLSTLVFALFHVYEVATVLGAIILALQVGVLGLANCYLVRITGRLTPGMMVHATNNAVSVLVLAL